jgi:hypothetical protein
VIPPADERALRELFDAACGLARRLNRETRRAARRSQLTRAELYADAAASLHETLVASARVLGDLGVAGVDPHRIPPRV